MLAFQNCQLALTVTHKKPPENIFFSLKLMAVVWCVYTKDTYSDLV